MGAPGCPKRRALSGSTRPPAIFSSVDLPDPLRPIRQTRSDCDTDSSTPDNSGVPPKVGLMSFSWISGGAITSQVPYLLNSILCLCGLFGALPLDAADGLVERRQERRAVARSE